MALETEKDLLALENRFRELADKSFQQNIYTFSSFLGLAEQDVFWRMEKELSYATCVFQGSLQQGEADTTDRKILRFGNSGELGYEIPFPIVCIHMKPLLAKFADNLSHRDFLGALMNLGIDRSTLGDIKVGEKEGYLYCLDSIADFICENLDKVRHTNITCKRVESLGEIPPEEPKYLEVLSSGERVDGVVAKVYHMSRTDSLEQFRGKKVFINGRLCENNSRNLKAGEVVNVRGFGKFLYQGIKHETKKGKICLQVQVYQ